jgi:hypothetical protein
LFLGEKFREAHDDDEIRRRGSCVNWYEDETTACETVAAAEENTTKVRRSPQNSFPTRKEINFFFSDFLFHTMTTTIPRIHQQNDVRYKRETF